MKPKYVNPFTDFGFKKLFGEEASKPLLLDFLNALLALPAPIATLAFKNAEQMGQTEADRRAIFDIYCETATGEKFIVELQKAKQNYFKDRTVYYATFPIREQAERGEWNYRLQAVYCVGILDFTFDDYAPAAPERGEVLHTIRLKNQHGAVFYDKLTFLYLEMPNFRKTEAELETRLDQWLYFIRNLEDFQSIPALFGDDIFHQAFAKAELATLPPAELDRYEHNLKIYRDLKAVIDTAYDEGELRGEAKGRAEGLAEGEAIGEAKGERNAQLETARRMREKGFSVADVAEMTGLTPAEVAAL